MRTFAAIAVVIAISATTRAQGPILGVWWTGTASAFDSANANPWTIGPTGATSVNAMGLHPPSGTIYITQSIGFPPPISTLWTVDPFTGAGTNTGVGVIGDVRALAFDPAGTCFAIIDGIQDALYTIDIATGARTLVGSTGRTGVQALESDAAGGLWGWDLGPGSPGLVSISKTTGVATSVGSSNVNVQALAFSPTGVLYGGAQTLYAINTTTGGATFVNQLNSLTDVRGLAFLYPVLPSVSFLPLSGVVAPGDVLVVHYTAPNNAGETFAPVISCTLGSFSAPFLPQPLGIAWDACTDFYFNDPASLAILPLCGFGYPYTNTLGSAGTGKGFFFPPTSLPSGMNLQAHVTFVSWTAASAFTVHGVGTLTVN